VAAQPTTYGANNMRVLEGLEAVRKRPGMYIGSTGPNGLHHCVWEVVDNSVDEAMAGYCTRIDITLLPDGGCRVVDDGRGIPTDMNEQQGMTGVEIALTKLHGGGKFDGEGYKVSGGLHGVGVSVVNALSERVVVEVDRDGKRFHMEFGDGGKPQTALEVVGDAPRGRTGTTVTFWPDPRIFETTEFRAQTIRERIQMMAFLNKGLEIRFQDQREGHDNERISYKYSGGIIDFVRHINKTKEALWSKVGYFEGSDDTSEVEIAFQWNTGYNRDGIHSFANGISTIEGGTHEEGFKTALTRVVNAYAKDNRPGNVKDLVLTGDDVREGLTAVVSVRLQEPQFEGQTKAKLGNTAMRSLVTKVTNEYLAQWFEENPTEANKVIKKAYSAAQAREAAKNARNAIRSKTLLDGAGMPDKLKDCSAKDREERELFIVEGDSAGGSAVSARDPRTQAILPIRGKIIAMCDADVDGSHIRTLLLTFFFRQMKPLVEAGCIYIAQPPLYSTQVGKSKIYLKDDRAQRAFMAENPNHKKDFQRLKGLGEMDASELEVTTMNPDSRTLLQVTVEQAALADEVMSVLMGDDVAARKDFIVANAKDVKFVDI
jgi:DNA gyrase subunit B